MTDPFHLILNRYALAVRAKDAEAYLALYADDVHIFDAWGDWSLHGIDAWRAATVDWFSSLGSETVAVTAHDPHATVNENLAIGHVFLTFTAFSAEGTQLRWLTNRFTMGLTKHAENWTIIHQHSSAPIDGSTLKAKLQRPR